MRQGLVVWITGLPGSGKSTLADALVRALRKRGEGVLWLDSDDLRRVLTPEPRYDDAERDRFHAALGHLASLAASGGVTVVISATASKQAYRDAVRRDVPRFVEVLLECDRAELERRDPKGLYARARTGEITSLPGAGAPYERPPCPELTLDSARNPPLVLADHVLRWLDAGADRLAVAR